MAEEAELQGHMPFAKDAVDDYAADLFSENIEESPIKKDKRISGDLISGDFTE